MVPTSMFAKITKLGTSNGEKCVCVRACVRACVCVGGEEGKDMLSYYEK